jgi:hypothetical protein
MPRYDQTREFEDFRYTLPMNGLEDQVGLYYSLYRAKVVSVDDPEQRGRVQVTIPSVGMRETDVCEVWVDPMTDMVGPSPGMGWFMPPVPGSHVRVVFDRGDPSLPKGYTGGWFTTAEGTSPVPAVFSYTDGRPQKRGFRSRAGHLLVFDDSPGEESLSIIWHKPDSSDPAASDPDAVAAPDSGLYAQVSFRPDGSILVQNAAGAYIVLSVEDAELQIVDASGNRIDLKGEDGITITANSPNGADYIKFDRKGGIDIVAGKAVNIVAPTVNIKAGGVYNGELAKLSAVLGEPLLAWLTSHSHPTGMGPSGTPVPPPTPALLSKAVKVK